MVGVGNIQVDGVPFRERRWVAGVTERCGDNNRYSWGAVAGEEMKQPRKWLRQVERGGIIIVVITSGRV